MTVYGSVSKLTRASFQMVDLFSLFAGTIGSVFQTAAVQRLIKCLGKM